MEYSKLTNKSVELVVCEIVSHAMDDRPHAKQMVSNIAPLVQRLTIFENIFRPTLTGEIELQDNASLSTLIPLMGTEQLRIAFRVFDTTTTTSRTYGTAAHPLVFNVCAQSSRRPIGVGAETYTLSLVSPEMFTSTERQISRSYRNMRVEDIIRDLLTSAIHSTKTFTDVETTSTPTTITFPYTSPLNAIKLLMLYGQNDGLDSSYVFYETLRGFHFTSLRRMIQNGGGARIPTITQRIAGLNPNRATSRLTYADALEVTSGYDMLYLLSQGYFASTTFKVDVLAGQFDVGVSRSSDEAFQQRPRINGPRSIPIYPIETGFLGIPTSKIFVVPTTEISMTIPSMRADDSIRDNFIATTIDGRNRELLSLQMRTIRGQVSGMPELHAGSLVNVIFPTPLSNEFDGRGAVDIATGRYLIVASRHSLINTGVGEFAYETVFEAGTDSIPVG